MVCFTISTQLVPALAAGLKVFRTAEGCLDAPPERMQPKGEFG